MANKIQLRRDTLDNWENVNPILGDGEPGFVIDTNQVKYGDGSTPWNDLGWGGAGLNPLSVAIGRLAGETNQADSSVAVGRSAGRFAQGEWATAVGPYAGRDTQGDEAVAVGDEAGYYHQGYGAVAIGGYGWWEGGAGSNSQGNNAVAIGASAGQNNQGAFAIAIGSGAGYNYQTTGSIAILAGSNAGNIGINNAGLYIDPIRNDLTSTSIGLFYDVDTKEITYNTAATPNALINGTHSVTLDATGALTGDGANGNFYIDTITSTGTTSTWVFGVSGTTTLPGAVVLSTEYPVGETLPGTTGVALDLTKQVQVLNYALYSLADGVEGQIMYFVPATGGGNSVVIIANARIMVDNVATVGSQVWTFPSYVSLAVFEPPKQWTIATAIFTDGAWNLLGGSQD